MTLNECKEKFPLRKIIESFEPVNKYGSPSDVCDGMELFNYLIVGYCTFDKDNKDENWYPVVQTEPGVVKWYFPSLSGWKIIDNN